MSTVLRMCVPLLSFPAESTVACCSCRMGGICRCQSWPALAKARLDVPADGGPSQDLFLFGLHSQASCWGLEGTGWLMGVPIWNQGMQKPFCIHGHYKTRNRDSLWYQCLALHS